MTNQNFNNLNTSIKAVFSNNTEIAKGIKNLVDNFAKDFQTTQEDVLFVTMKEFVAEYQTSSALQFYHYLGNIEHVEIANMLNFLDLCRQ